MYKRQDKDCTQKKIAQKWLLPKQTINTAVSYTHLDVYKRQAVYVADVVVHQPRGFVGADPGAHHHRLVPANGVEGKSWRVIGQLHNFAVGNQTELDPVSYTHLFGWSSHNLEVTE